MTKKQNNTTYMGINGPVGTARTTFGINTSRLANARPVVCNDKVVLARTVDYLNGKSFILGRHLFGRPTSQEALSVNAIPGVPVKAADYVVTGQGPHIIASQTVCKRTTSNGKTTFSLDLPYYDAEAVQTLEFSDAPGAVAPLGSFKVKVELLGGGILTGTDAKAQLAIDELLMNMLRDMVEAADSLPENAPRFASASHAQIPLAAPSA